jgi:hypothetical protein
MQSNLDHRGKAQQQLHALAARRPEGAGTGISRADEATRQSGFSWCVRSQSVHGMSNARLGALELQEFAGTRHDFKPRPQTLEHPFPPIMGVLLNQTHLRPCGHFLCSSGFIYAS